MVKVDDDEFELGRNPSTYSLTMNDPKQGYESKGNDSIRPNNVASSLLLEPCGNLSTNEDRTKRRSNIQKDEFKNINSISCDDRGWHWLLTPTGSHYPIDSAQAAKKEEPCRRKKARISTSTKTPQKGSWRWLVTKDGSPSTVNSSASFRTKKRKRDGEDFRASNRRGNDCVLLKATEDGSPSTVNSSTSFQKGSWRWLVTEDGSPSTVDSLVSFGTKKRKQDGEDFRASKAEQLVGFIR